VEVLRHMLWPELWAHSSEDERPAAAPTTDGRESATEDARGDVTVATAVTNEQAQQQRAARLTALAAAINAVAERVNYGGATVRFRDFLRCFFRFLTDGMNGSIASDLTNRTSWPCGAGKSTT